MKKRFLLVFVLLMSSAAAFSQEYNFDAKPVDLNAIKNVYRLKKYFTDIYGTKIISGQMDLTWHDKIDMAQRVYDDTGKYPAHMGFDFMNYKGRSGDGTKQVEEAVKWWEKGGIVTFCWHWRDPSSTNTWAEFYSEKTNVRIPYDSSTHSLKEGKVLDGIKKDLDKIASQLLRLQEKEIPVLWRPLHEASGKWFWWGASGSDAYLALYKFMFKYFTEEKGIHNLLWVWNGQDSDWYPGDEYVDIMGMDIYASNYSSQNLKFDQCWYMSDNPETNPKMIALSENGRIPSPKDLEDEAVWWLYFMTWNDTAQLKPSKDNFWYGDKVNTLKHKKEVYSSDYVITLDELPDLKNYPVD